MAYTTFLMTVSMVAIANAGFPGWPANDNPFPGFPSPMMSSLRFGPIASPPSMPGMPTFPQNFPFFPFHDFPTISNFPILPTVAELASQTPTKGGSFNSVIVSTKTNTKINEDGTISKDPQTTIYTNTDGVITVKQIGNDLPAKSTTRKKIQNEFDFDDPKIKPNPNQFKNFNNFKKNEDFDNFGFRHIFPDIDIKKIESYVPGEGETFKAQSVRTHSFSTNNNGQVNAGGSATRIDNDNGHVNKEKVVYNSDGTQS